MVESSNNLCWCQFSISARTHYNCNISCKVPPYLFHDEWSCKNLTSQCMMPICVRPHYLLHRILSCDLYSTAPKSVDNLINLKFIEKCSQRCSSQFPIDYSAHHDDVIKWKHFHVAGPFCGEFTGPGIHKGQWRGALMFPLICVWINGWVNNREAGDLKRHRGHYDVSVLCFAFHKVGIRYWSIFDALLRGPGLVCFFPEQPDPALTASIVI